ncbi:esterase B1-like isoform X2 [Contarinia nasturtii]|uniref:esterase B1-like isoform X2 n=1 Tax=Contarinia nasturtii TaxID=265458 RepID=UPI0012D4534B|nr:esterase B1-like isoform X2 [Contarinia nasturtii]
MCKFILINICLWQWIFVIVNCDYLRVNTTTGPMIGVSQTTFVNKVPYLSYKGVPYAQPPIGELRFKTPLAVKPWSNPIVTTDEFQPSCLVLASSKFLELNSKQSENCLFLNVYTPVMDKIKVNKKLPVLFFIPGGGFTEGDGTDGYYGPDFILEHEVILVTINYRLGPFGFANFDVEGYTGNMGLKDQRLALNWVKENIVFFGGDPNSIALAGESAGSVSVHLHLLTGGCEHVNRAIMWSGHAFNYWAYYRENNQLNVLRETFKDELGNRTSKRDLLDFMIHASAKLIVEKTPTSGWSRNTNTIFWTPAIEDKSKAIQPFLTEKPHKIYANNRFSSHCKNVEVFAGITSSAKIKQFYFGDEEIEATPEHLNQYIQMFTDIHFLIPFYETMRLHAKVSKMFCHFFDIDLGTNIIKKSRHLEMVDRMGHIEDIGYMFKANQFVTFYNQTMENRSEVTNQKTIKAWHFVSKLFTDFVKTGRSANSSPVESVESAQCVHIMNDGLGSIIQPRKERMELWNQIREYLKPYIIDEY